MKIIIIGSIAAGVSAAARLAAAQRGAQITVYEKGGFYSCGTGGLPHYLCEDLDSLNKAIQAKETELNAQGITAHLRHEVRGIDAAARKVTVCDLATGRVFEDHYDKLVLATGSSNRVPQVPGSDRVGVQTLKTVEDLSQGVRPHPLCAGHRDPGRQLGRFGDRKVLPQAGPQCAYH